MIEWCKKKGIAISNAIKGISDANVKNYIKQINEMRKKLTSLGYFPE